MLDVNKLLADTKAAMQKSIDHLEVELQKIRAGRSNPAMLDAVFVDYYGTNTPVNQVANISTPDARTLQIQPWEKTMLKPIEKAITEANLGFNPQNDGSVIRINIPPLTEDRRKEMVKKSKAEAEHAKVGIRTSRKDANEAIKRDAKATPEDICKDAEDRIQKVTDQFVAAVDKHLEAKEKEIMTI
ncbi:MAG: hypothetical protein RIQ89_982 [Bacteroidota bacterium]|jgi:ribosome recycling factor